VADRARDPAWPARAVGAQLGEHLASLAPPREVSSDEAQPLADAMWALLDRLELGSRTSAARARGEDAAEALLRDRTASTSRQAAEEALAAVGDIAPFTDPPGDPCDELYARVRAAWSAGPCTAPRSQ
jgi:hypothetical protein